MSYKNKIEAFRAAFEEQYNARLSRLNSDSKPCAIKVETGYKFDKVFVITSTGQQVGRYMVETRTGDIYGIKSWTQVNKRRWFGTLNSVGQYDWSESYARPLPGTDAEREQFKRETKIKSGHKKRGRKSNAELLQAAN